MLLSQCKLNAFSGLELASATEITSKKPTHLNITSLPNDPEVCNYDDDILSQESLKEEDTRTPPQACHTNKSCISPPTL